MKLSPLHVARLEAFLDRLDSDIYPEAEPVLHAEITQRMMSHLVERHAPPAGGRVLDVGCGQGLALRAFRERGFDAMGMTRGEADREACESEQLHVVDADPSFSDLPDASFDVVWCRHFLEHSPFPYFTLCELRRLLREQGLLYLEVPAPDTGCGHEDNPNHYSVLGRNMWLSLLRRAGFEMLEAIDFVFTTRAGQDTYWAFFCSAGERTLEPPSDLHPATPVVDDTVVSAYLCLPLQGETGWAVCGRNLAREMSALSTVRVASADFDALDDPFERDALGRILAPRQVLEAVREGRPVQVSAPVLHAVEGISLRPALPNVRGPWQVGYTFFERRTLPWTSVENARRHFDRMAAGSTWCAQVLRAHGFDDVVTVLQGVDTTVFEPSKITRTAFRERFVVFSGGKFELRKGQDLVLRAFAALARKYPDMLLLAAWSNPWEFSIDTMRSSPYIRLEEGRDFVNMVERTAEAHGIPPDQLMVAPPLPQERLARLYKNTDVGLFPNRCEGGTNLVLMEYMACGKPVIGAFNTGHRDILTPANSLPLFSAGRLVRDLPDGTRIDWDDPSLDEIIAHLEWAYLHREKLRRLGRRAARDLAAFTWKRTARQFVELLAPR